MKNILLVQTGFIGDVILSSPLITALKKYYPDSNLTLLTTPLASDLYRNHPDLKEVLVFDKRKSQKGFWGLLEMAKELRSKSFDAVYSLHKSSRTSILLFLSGIKERYSFEESKLNFLYTKTCKRSDLPHDVLRNLAVLRVHDLKPEDYACHMSIGTSVKLKEQALALIAPIKDLKIIAIAPGSVWATKRLPVETFLEVAIRCLRDGYGVVLLGGPDDRALGDFLVNGIKESGFIDRCVDVIAKCPLSVSAEIVRLSSLVISNDSSPLHMASATGVPVVATFCATVPEQGFGPWMVPYKIIEVKDLECRPCGRHGGNICPTGTHACQKGIKSENIYSAVSELMGAS